MWELSRSGELIIPAFALFSCLRHSDPFFCGYTVNQLKRMTPLRCALYGPIK